MLHPDIGRYKNWDEFIAGSSSGTNEFGKAVMKCSLRFLLFLWTWLGNNWLQSWENYTIKEPWTWESVTIRDLKYFLYSKTSGGHAIGRHSPFLYHFQKYPVKIIKNRCLCQELLQGLPECSVETLSVWSSGFEVFFNLNKNVYFSPIVSFLWVQWDRGV